jgi:hypothetical protein
MSNCAVRLRLLDLTFGCLCISESFEDVDDEPGDIAVL